MTHLKKLHRLTEQLTASQVHPVKTQVDIYGYNRDDFAHSKLSLEVLVFYSKCGRQLRLQNHLLLQCLWELKVSLLLHWMHQDLFAWQCLSPGYSNL